MFRIALLGALTSFAGSIFLGACGPRSTDSDPVDRPIDSDSVGWLRQFGTSEHGEATSVAVDGQGNVWIAGSTEGALPSQSSAGG
ncbi:SBBP repeat-containing protein [Synechococcus sp. W70.1]|uniref:SBBP repeat-containing protein n=1 Tax=unclassified Synechococcus TaxID=2626047 RepID=UPI0039C3ECE4